MIKEKQRCCGYACEDCIYFPRFEEDETRVDLNWVSFSKLLPTASYYDYRRALYGEPGKLGRLYLTAGLDKNGLVVARLETVRPALGGYRSEKKYGRPDYCPTATRWHKKNIAEHGVSPNLIYFDNVEAAVLAGFSPCGNCYLKGEEGLTNWQEYLAICKKMGIEPVEPPKRLSRMSGI